MRKGCSPWAGPFLDRSPREHEGDERGHHQDEEGELDKGGGFLGVVWIHGLERDGVACRLCLISGGGAVPPDAPRLTARERFDFQYLGRSFHTVLMPCGSLE